MSETIKCPICGKPLVPLTASTLSLTPTCNHDVAKIWRESGRGAVDETEAKATNAIKKQGPDGRVPFVH